MVNLHTLHLVWLILISSPFLVDSPVAPCVSLYSLSQLHLDDPDYLDLAKGSLCTFKKKYSSEWLLIKQQIELIVQ